MATTVREVMSGDCECIGETQTLADAAKRMKELDVGALPICGEDDKLKGMLTDRDIVVDAVAEGRDPAQTKAGELASGRVHWVSADDSIDDALRIMSEHAVRRVPVLDENKRLCGIVSQGDVAIHANEAQTGEVVQEISQAPSN